MSREEPPDPCGLTVECQSVAQEVRRIFAKRAKKEVSCEESCCNWASEWVGGRNDRRRVVLYLCQADGGLGSGMAPVLVSVKHSRRGVRAGEDIVAAGTAQVGDLR